METISYFDPCTNKSYQVPINSDESVLDSLLNAGFSISHGCKNGVCQSCMLQTSTPDLLPKESQINLSKSKIDNNFFLSCQCPTIDGLSIFLTPSLLTKHTVKIIDKKKLNSDVLYLKIDAPFKFKPGQFINIYKNDSTSRSYSIASVDDENDFLELHIKLIRNGLVSEWLHESIKVSNTITIDGPNGDCYFQPKTNQQSILLLCIGTGLAPIIGILKKAIANNHKGKITLMIGANLSAQFYLLDELKQLVKENLNICVILIFREGDDGTIDSPLIGYKGDIYNQIQTRFSTLKDHQIYLCGAESFVKKATKWCYLNDAKVDEIFADAFISAG